MATRKREVTSIEQTREYKVLEEYHDMGGSGLTANALCYLTGQRWSTVRRNLTNFASSDEDNESRFGLMYCHDVCAPVFYVSHGWYNQHPLSHEHLELADKIVKKYPPSRFRGSVDEKGQRELTFNWVDEEYFDEEGWCGDPTCCPEPKAKSKQSLKEVNRKVVQRLRACWK